MEDRPFFAAFVISRPRRVRLGKAEGRRITLAKLLQLKFGPLSEDVRDLWAERILFAATIELIFAP